MSVTALAGRSRPSPRVIEMITGIPASRSGTTASNPMPITLPASNCDARRVERRDSAMRFVFSTATPVATWPPAVTRTR